MKEEQTGIAVHHAKPPEKLEVERLIEQLERRKERIVELELELETTKQELGRFQAEIDRRLGPLYVELDQLKLRQKQYEARMERLQRLGKQAARPSIEEQIAREFQEQWQQVKDSEERVRSTQPMAYEPQLDQEEEAELKKTYRRLARRFHPDLAESETERICNLQIMTEINRAYAEKDLAQLKLIETREYSESEPWQESTGEKLVRLIRRRHELDRVITRLEGQVAELRVSETYKLMQKSKEEGQYGKDAILVLELALKGEIVQAEKNLENAIAQFKDLVVETFWGPLD